jgi:hypothetical protein
MGVLGDLRILYHMALRPVRGKSHAERMNNFYSGQAADYDDFRRRLLRGREDLWQKMLQGAPYDNTVWMDMGGGTGSNLHFLGASKFMRRFPSRRSTGRSRGATFYSLVPITKHLFYPLFRIRNWAVIHQNRRGRDVPRPRKFSTTSNTAGMPNDRDRDSTGTNRNRDDKPAGDKPVRKRPDGRLRADRRDRRPADSTDRTCTVRQSSCTGRDRGSQRVWHLRHWQH